jgi:hypothetical protein
MLSEALNKSIDAKEEYKNPSYYKKYQTKVTLYQFTKLIILLQKH